MAAHVHVILSRDVSHLGHLGEVVRVRPGFARNYLFPKFLALPITGARLAQVEHQKRLIEHRKQKLRGESEVLAKSLTNTQITIHAKAGDHGKLFGSIGTRDIEKALTGAGYSISHRDIKLEHPLKTVGLHSIEVRLEADVKGTINVVVVPEVTETSAPVAAANDTAAQAV